MIEAYKKFWKNYVNFSGVSSISDFWYVTLMNFLIVIGVFVVSFLFLFITGIKEEITMVQSVFLFIIILALAIYFLASIIPGIAIRIRRLRDGGFHWGLIFLSLIPSIGGIIMLVLLLMPTAEQNKVKM